MDEEAWAAVLSVNLNGVFYTTKAFLDGMLERKYGRIVHISSIVGQVGNFGQANYAAAKAALFGLTKTLAKELATRGITVNAVAPGFIDTEMVAAVAEEVREKIVKQIPMGRLGTAAEVAKAVVFLLSDDASYITGQTINVNGGMYV
jgi:NAD(P)-dependent dehydrogenase (short-subunit alcohol dehydrogenase family)